MLPLVLAPEEGIAFFQYFNAMALSETYGIVWTSSWKQNLQGLANVNHLPLDYFSPDVRAQGLEGDNNGLGSPAHEHSSRNRDPSINPPNDHQDFEVRKVVGNDEIYSHFGQSTSPEEEQGWCNVLGWRGQSYGGRLVR